MASIHQFRCSKDGLSDLRASFVEQAKLSSSENTVLVSESVLLDIGSKAIRFLSKLENMARITVAEESPINLVGDLHGQFFDLDGILNKFGLPSRDNPYLFLGDYVDRGSFGVEVFYLLLAVLLVEGREAITLLRGNHETEDMCSEGGFHTECVGKYSETLFYQSLEVFQCLQISALLSGGVVKKKKGVNDSECRAFCVHGGLFRSADSSEPNIFLGDLSTIRSIDRKVSSPEWGSSFEDMLWSDPSMTRNLVLNDMRGAGLFWGPNATEEFLKSTKTSAIFRAHEGPDARLKRFKEMKSIDDGHVVDHDGPSGKSHTVFSAPCYPEGVSGSTNRGSVLQLSAPSLSVKYNSVAKIKHETPIWRSTVQERFDWSQIC